MYMANLGRALTNQGWNQMILRVLSNVTPSDSVILGGFLEGISVSHSKQQALLCPDQVFCLHVLPWMFIKRFWRTLWLQADKFPRVHKRPSYSMPLTTPVNLKELLCPYPCLICMYAYTYKISVFIQTQTCKTARGEVWIYIRTELELVWCSLQQHSALDLFKSRAVEC